MRASVVVLVAVFTIAAFVSFAANYKRRYRSVEAGFLVDEYRLAIYKLTDDSGTLASSNHVTATKVGGREGECIIRHSKAVLPHMYKTQSTATNALRGVFLKAARQCGKGQVGFILCDVAFGVCTRSWSVVSVNRVFVPKPATPYATLVGINTSIMSDRWALSAQYAL